MEGGRGADAVSNTVPPSFGNALCAGASRRRGTTAVELPGMQTPELQDADVLDRTPPGALRLRDPQQAG